MTHTIAPATVDDSALMSQIAMTSKAYWGYNSKFMQAVTPELEVSATRLRDRRFDYQLLLNQSGEICGFYALLLSPDKSALSTYQVNQADVLLDFITSKQCKIAELEGLFVSPLHMSKGYGQALFLDACNRCKERGFEQLLIQSDPNALNFYLKQGCLHIGCKESGSIAGRQLPLLSYVLTSD